MKIRKFNENEEVNISSERVDEILKELIKETGDKYIETDNLICQNGDTLPSPFTKEEVRDAKIDIINE